MSGQNKVRVLRNIGGGQFQLGDPMLVDGSPVAACSIDLNHDEAPDIVTANYNSNKASVLMNRRLVRPTVPTPIKPVDDSATNSTTPRLIIWNSTEPTLDSISYEYQVLSDSAETVVVANSGLITETADSTIWTVNTPLIARKRFGWTSRAFDGYRYSDWSNVESFWTLYRPQAPTAPVLIDPPDSTGLPLFNLKPTLRWIGSTVPDPLDTVHYKLELSFDAAFTFAVPVDSLAVTQFAFAQSLFFGTHYWWRVKAIERTGLTTVSTATKNFWTWELGDVDNSHNTDIADLSKLIDHLYIGFSPITPNFIADLDGDCHVDISDLTRMIDYLYLTFAPLGVGCEQ